MSTTSLGMTTQLNDAFNYSVTDPLSDTVAQVLNLLNTYKMVYGQTTNSSTSTTTTPTKFAILQHTITIASSTYDIDITGIVDIFGNSFATISKVYYVLIHNNDVAGGSGLLLGGAGSNPWSGPFNGQTTKCTTVAAGGEWRQTNPYTGFTVSAGSKVLRITNDAASPSGSAGFTMIIAGS